MKKSNEIREVVERTPEEYRSSPEYANALFMLLCALESENIEGENDDEIREIGRRLISDYNNVLDSDKLCNCYDSLARSGDFEAFMIAMEWNRPLNKKFYIPRARVFKKLGVVEAIQDLVDDKLDLLVINCPPRIGKTTLGMFLIVFMAGLHPERSILASGHSTALTNSFYREFLNFVTSDEYRFKEVFPFKENTLVFQNAEYCQADLGVAKRFHTVNFRSVDAGTTGIVEASNLLYLDDLVVDAEQANSKDRLDKLFSQYTSTLKDRKVQRLCKDGVYRPAPEVFIGTPWSLYDPMSRVIQDMEENGDKSRIRVIKMPCWNEFHESNFMYDYGLGFNVKYYEDMERVEDPVIFSAKYLCTPVEREGRPFEKNSLQYYDELPIDEKGEIKVPDRIVFVNDVAHGGDDFMSMPIALQYGPDFYITDVLFIHNFDGDKVSRPQVCNKIINNHCSAGAFERNNGGDFYSSMITEDLLKQGYRCNITTYNAPTNKSKLDRILMYQSEIHNHVFFKSERLRRGDSQYCEFLNNIWQWSQKPGATQKKQHDDGIDSIAQLLARFGERAIVGFKLYDIKKAGY